MVQEGISSSTTSKRANIGFEPRSPKVQQSIPTPKNNEGMLLSRPNFKTCTNAFGEIWITHISLIF